MLELPYWTIAIIYLVGILIFIVLAGLYISTMMRYGMFDGHGKLYTFCFLLFTVINLGLVVLASISVDWQHTFVLTTPGPFTLPSL